MKRLLLGLACLSTFIPSVAIANDSSRQIYIDSVTESRERMRYRCLLSIATYPERAEEIKELCLEHDLYTGNVLHRLNSDIESFRDISREYGLNNSKLQKKL